ncbi:hypothetical protein V8D89_009183 [Ganoderma adspersum]
MPTDEFTGEQYEITSEGTNASGNKWEHRVSESGKHGYHYSNQSGSYYSYDFDASSYYNDVKGYSRTTTSEGKVTETWEGNERIHPVTIVSLQSEV